jgi:hypothetical protein
VVTAVVRAGSSTAPVAAVAVSIGAVMRISPVLGKNLQYYGLVIVIAEIG